MAALALASATGANPVQALILDPLVSAKEQAIQTCNGTTGVDEEEEVLASMDTVDAPPDQLVTYWLRMCIYSAHDLPYGDAYCVVELGDGNVIATTPTQNGTETPVWEHSFEVKFDVDGRTPPLILKIYDSNLLGDKLLGSSTIKLPTKPTTGAKRQKLRLKNVPSLMCSAPKKSSIVVTWQVCESIEKQPDLLQISELDAADMEQKEYTVTCELKKLKLRKPLKKPTPTPALVKFQLYNAASSTKQKAQISPTAMIGGLRRQNEAMLEAKWKDENNPQDPDLGWTASWTLRESKANLLSYFFSADLFTVPDGDGEHFLGSFSESVMNIEDAIEQNNRKQCCWCILHSSVGAIAGRIYVEIDIFPSSEGTHPEPVVDDIEMLPKLRGEMQAEERNKKMEYYVFLYGDYFPRIGKDSCDPYIKISMGHAASACKAKNNALRRVEWKDEPLKVVTTQGIRKAKVELWNDNSSFMFGTDDLVGESMIYDVQPNKSYWIHFFGGVLNPPRDRTDECFAMTKGAISPPSTYRGSVCLHFGVKLRINKSHWLRIQESYQKRTLTVRLYRGLYLRALAGSRVNVLVQVPTTELPTKDKKAKDNGGCSCKMPTCGSCCAEKDATKEKLALISAMGSNRDILSFPGEIDENGILRFTAAKTVAEVKGGGGCCGCGRRSCICGASSTDKRCLWVERSTPLQFPLEVLPDVSHAFIYIQVAGQEFSPPQIFGKIRLGGHPTTSSPSQKHAAQDLRPNWRRLRWDESVTAPPEAHFQKATAGWILGWAHMDLVDEPQKITAGKVMDEPGKEGTASSAGEPSIEGPVVEDMIQLPDPKHACCSVTKPREGFLGSNVKFEQEVGAETGEKSTQSVYLHVDVLAARNLPALDEDGLSDPGYNIRCESVKLEGCEDLPKSLNPTLMHRACIKVETQILETPTSIGCAEASDGSTAASTARTDLLPVEPDIPLPPVMFNMYEVDREISGQVTKNMIGTIVCKRPRNLDQTPAPLSGLLDVNSRHQAVWYLLDGTGYAPFNPTKEGGIKNAWRSKSRVLLSIGYSMQEGETGVTDGFRPLQTGNLQAYAFTIDLLGMRKLRLPPPAIGSIYKAGLQIISYWEKAIELDIADQELPNPNFKGEVPAKEEWQPIADTVKKLVQIVEHVDDDEDKGADDSAAESDPNKLPPIDKVGLDEFVGMRISPPPFRAQIIPYLQLPDWSGLDPGDEHDNSVVLLPDVTFKLRNNLGLADIGSLSMPLGPYERIMRERGGTEERMNKMRADTASLGEVHKNLYPIQNVVTKDDYDILIDVVAPTTGNLLFDDSTRMGRALQEGHLFDVVVDEDAGDFTPVNFNDDDYLLNNPMFLDEAFDYRCMPHLKVDRVNEHPKSTEDLFKTYRSIKESKKDELPMPKKKLKPGEKPVALKPEDLTSMGEHKLKMRKLKTCLQEDGFRCVTHLYSPGLLSPDKPIGEIGAPATPEVRATIEQSLKQNFHTYMRPVGHQIVSRKESRNSRYLAKLRLHTREDPDKPRTRNDPREAPTPVFVVVRFNQPGTIVWAAPKHIDKFDTIGDLLFVVQLEDEDQTLVRVTVPNLDLRYPYETAFYVRKHCATRWMTLQKMIEAQELQRAKEAEQAKRKRVAKKAAAKAADSKKNVADSDQKDSSDDDGPDEDEGEGAGDKKQRRKPMPPPDGYSRPIPVMEGEFVLRMQRRPGGLYFDREQTDNWYAAALGEVFPDIMKYVDEGKDAVKGAFQESVLNLRKVMTAGESSVETGLLKGHVTVKRISEEDARQMEPDRSTEKKTLLGGVAGGIGAIGGGVAGGIGAIGGAIGGLGDAMPDALALPTVGMPTMPVGVPTIGLPSLGLEDKPPMYIPLEHFWQVDTVNVHVYILTGRQLKLNGDTADPYMQVEVVGGATAQSESQGLFINDSDPDFYEHFVLSANLPGASSLGIKVMDKGLVSDSLIGECHIDLEDRWLAMTQTKMRCLTQQTHLKRFTSLDREYVKEDYKSSGGGTTARTFQPLLAPFPPLPLETRRIHCYDEETGEKNDTGLIRFWVDLVSADTEYIDATFQKASIDFEIRMTVWDVNGISIWADMGQRNDLYVKGILVTKGVKGNVTQKNFETDIHKFSHDRAVFNWRWVLDIRMPVTAAVLKFRLCDSDSLTGDDPLYDPKLMPLDHMLMLAYRLEVTGKPPLGTATRRVIFDTWGAEKKSSKVGCCGRLLGNQEPTPAIMTLDIQVLPKSVASSSPVGEGREGPHPLPPPGERMEWATAVTEPVRFAKVMLGPVNWSRCSALCCCLVVVILLMTALALMFFASQTFATM